MKFEPSLTLTLPNLEYVTIYSIEVREEEPEFSVEYRYTGNLKKEIIEEMLQVSVNNIFEKYLEDVIDG